MKFVLTNPGLLCPFVMSFSVPSPSPYPTFRLPRLFQFCLHVASFTGVWSNKFNNNYCRRTAERYSSKKRPTQTGTYAHANAHLESCLSRSYFLSLCTFIHVIRRLDAIIRLAAAARSWAISERCIKYLALLASKVLILAAAATCLHRPLALAAGPVTSTFQFTYNPSRFPCLHNRSVSHIMSRCANCAIGGLSPQVDNGFASINKQNPVEVFPPIWPSWPIDTSFLRLIPHMQHAADPSPTCRACRHLACGTV